MSRIDTRNVMMHRTMLIEVRNMNKTALFFESYMPPVLNWGELTTRRRDASVVCASEHLNVMCICVHEIAFSDCCENFGNLCDPLVEYLHLLPSDNNNNTVLVIG